MVVEELEQTDQELLAELQETEIIFCRQPEDRKAFCRKVGKQNCVFYSISERTFIKPSREDIWAGETLYRISRDYKLPAPEPELVEIERLGADSRYTYNSQGYLIPMSNAPSEKGFFGYKWADGSVTQVCRKCEVTEGVGYTATKEDPIGWLRTI